MPSISVTFSYLFFLVPLVLGYDEVSDFCSRWDHQSIVKNNRLYIDGIYHRLRGRVFANKVKGAMNCLSPSQARASHIFSESVSA
jgi:hypothetical protein